MVPQSQHPNSSKPERESRPVGRGLAHAIGCAQLRAHGNRITTAGKDYLEVVRQGNVERMKFGRPMDA